MIQKTIVKVIAIVPKKGIIPVTKKFTTILYDKYDYKPSKKRKMSLDVFNLNYSNLTGLGITSDPENFEIIELDNRFKLELDSESNLYNLENDSFSEHGILINDNYFYHGLTNIKIFNENLDLTNYSIDVYIPVSNFLRIIYTDNYIVNGKLSIEFKLDGIQNNSCSFNVIENIDTEEEKISKLFLSQKKTKKLEQGYIYVNPTNRIKYLYLGDLNQIRESYVYYPHSHNTIFGRYLDNNLSMNKCKENHHLFYILSKDTESMLSCSSDNLMTFLNTVIPDKNLISNLEITGINRSMLKLEKFIKDTTTYSNIREILKNIIKTATLQDKDFSNGYILNFIDEILIEDKEFKNKFEEELLIPYIKNKLPDIQKHIVDNNLIKKHLTDLEFDWYKLVCDERIIVNILILAGYTREEAERVINTIL